MMQCTVITMYSETTQKCTMIYNVYHIQCISIYSMYIYIYIMYIFIYVNNIYIYIIFINKYILYFLQIYIIFCYIYIYIIYIIYIYISQCILCIDQIQINVSPPGGTFWWPWATAMEDWPRYQGTRCCRKLSKVWPCWTWFEFQDPTMWQWG